MNPPHHHPGVALGHLPFGMVTNGGGPVGIGIPIMTAPISVPSLPMPQQQQHPQQPKKMVSPDSSDDGNKDIRNNLVHHRTPSPNSPHSTNGGNPQPPPPQPTLPWPNQLLSNLGSLGGYPVMGMGMVPRLDISESNMLYGIISAATASELSQMPPNPNASQINLNLSIPNGTVPPQVPVMPVNPSGGSAQPLPQQQQQKPMQSQSLTLSLSQQQQQQQQSVSMPMSMQTQQQQKPKEIIHCPSCTLFPPNQSAPPPTTREKPPGCRTVFVGGLPENVTDELMREIFEKCGEITTIRMSKKNFAHIRFEQESFVENAIYLSGYRVRIGSNSDAANIGRLHVDYAQARDDLYEWECRERKLERERRHRERIEQERLLPTSPPPVVHYSEHEMSVVAEKLKVDETFIKAVQTFITWMERGDCTKKNANAFYSMIQSTNSHVRRLVAEKSQYDEELNKAKELMRQRMQGLLMQFGQIEKVFLAACHKKSWDHFTRAQRKNIDIWKKQAAEIKNMQLEEALNERTDEEMDLSDTESENENSTPGGKKMRIDEDEDKTLNQLKEENDSLRCQLEAFKNEVDLIKADLASRGGLADFLDKADLKTDLEAKDELIRDLQMQLHRSQSSSNCNPASEETSSPRESSSPSTSTTITPNRDNNNVNNGQTKFCSRGETLDSCDSSSNSISSARSQSNATTGSDINITETEGRLIAIISTFLHVHPFGASLLYINSFVQKVLPTVRPNQLESLLHKFPTLFREDTSGVGANLERQWRFLGFKSD